MPEDYNVIILVMDTARADIVNKGDVTPNIDSIASDGAMYTRAYSAAPWTLPSHASLFTGMYPSKHGTHAGHKKLSSKWETLAEVFSKNGYESRGISNNIWISDSFGFEKGFDQLTKNWQYFQSDTDLGKIGLTKHANDSIWSSAVETILTGNPVINLINGLYTKYHFEYARDNGAYRTNKRVRSWLDSRDNSEPFFLFLNYLEPHLEYRPPEEFANQFLPENIEYDDAMTLSQNAWKYITNQVDLSSKDFDILKALYKAEICYLDKKIGELKDNLINEGEWENTILLILGDHGENIGDHGLMDHQYCLYDSLIHVPFVAHGGPFTNLGKVEKLVQLVDICPTLTDVLSLESEGMAEQTQGVSIFNESTRSSIIAEYLTPQPSPDAIRRRVGDPNNVIKRYDRSLKAIQTDDFKLISGSDGEIELYPVNYMPNEDKNITSEYPEIVESLSKKLDNWSSSFQTSEYSRETDIDAETQGRLEDLGYI